jgi:hypothetical protein
MSHIKYIEWNASGTSLAIIEQAASICAEYAVQGYDLTLRQLYYQFVARGLLPNNQRSYKNLGSVIDKARKAGRMDWDYIVDRTRNLTGFNVFDDPADFITQMVDRYHIDIWRDQPHRIEVWVEKEALQGVVGRAADARAVNYFCCRGYVSQSELHSAAQRFRYYETHDQHAVVLYLGDHDPSGIDMTRDIQDRLNLFGANATVKRIALNMDQVNQYQPPPNPAKLTDARAASYIDEFGSESWELDALDPATLDQLIRSEIDLVCDQSLYQVAINRENTGLEQLGDLADRWDEIEGLLEWRAK